MDKYSKFFLYLNNCSKKFCDWLRNTDRIRLVSHFDADGVASAALMVHFMTKKGKHFNLSMIKQLKKERVKKLSEENKEMVIFMDLGSGHLKNIKEEMLAKKTKVVVLDHHELKGVVEDPNLLHLNPHLFGIDGGKDVSGAGVVLLFLKSIPGAGIENVGFLALVGAMGDNQETEKGFVSINKFILENETENEMITIKRGLRVYGRVSRQIHKALEYCSDPYIPGVSGSESGAVQLLSDLKIRIKDEKGNTRRLCDITDDERERLVTAIVIKRQAKTKNPTNIIGNVYNLKGREGQRGDLKEFTTMINSCSKQGRPALALSLCLDYCDKKTMAQVNSTITKRKKEIVGALRFVEQNKQDTSTIRQTENVFYILAGKNISDTIISTLCSIIAKSQTITEKSIVVGFAESGHAEAETNEVKVSVRQKDNAKEINLKEFVSNIAKKLGGEGGGHSMAAGAFIKRGQEEEFINLFEQLLVKENAKENKKG